MDRGSSSSCKSQEVCPLSQIKVAPGSSSSGMDSRQQQATRGVQSCAEHVFWLHIPFQTSDIDHTALV
jgi:hypothetical protein